MIVEFGNCEKCGGQLVRHPKRKGFKRCNSCSFAYATGFGPFLRRHGAHVAQFIVAVPLIGLFMSFVILAAHGAFPHPRLVVTPPTVKITVPSFTWQAPSAPPQEANKGRRGVAVAQGI